MTMKHSKQNSILGADDRVVRARDGRDPVCCRSIHHKPAAAGDGPPKGNRACAQRLPAIGSKQGGGLRS